MPKLSVIIALYNSEDYFRKCLDSALCPELADYEVIIVNDGSTDSSPVIAEEYCNKYPSIYRLINTPNGGCGHARNVGIDASLGDYLMFLDCDDHLASGAIPEMLELADGSFDLCFYDIVSVNEQGKALKYTEGFHTAGEFSLKSAPDMIFTTPAAWNKLYKRSVFFDTGIRFPEHKWIDDIRTVPKLYFAAGRCISVRKGWYNYLVRSGSMITSKDTKKNMDIIDALDELADYCRSIGKYDEYRDELEFLTLDHQLISATVRQNLADPRSPQQVQLAEDIFKKYPNCLKNPYIRQLSANRRIVLFLCVHRMYGLLNIIMRLNNALRQKRV